MEKRELIEILCDSLYLKAGVKAKEDCHPLASAALHGGGRVSWGSESAEDVTRPPLARIALAHGYSAMAGRPGMSSEMIADSRKVMAAGLSSSDFAKTLGELARHTAIQRLESARSDTLIAKRVSVPNFRDQYLGTLGLHFDLLLQPEGGEAQNIGPINIEDNPGLAARARSYSREFLITRAAILADNTRSIMDAWAGVGSAADRLQSKLVWELVESNPVLGDGGPMFDAGYNNLLSAAAISLTSIGEMTSALKRAATASGIEVNADAMYLVCAPEQETLAKSVVFNNGLELQVLATNRLTNAGNWYVFADPDLNPAVALLHLDASDSGIRFSPGDRKKQFATNGVTLEAAIDVGVAPVGRLGVVRRPTV